MEGTRKMEAETLRVSLDLSYTFFFISFFFNINMFFFFNFSGPHFFNIKKPRVFCHVSRDGVSGELDVAVGFSIILTM